MQHETLGNHNHVKWLALSVLIYIDLFSKYVNNWQDDSKCFFIMNF